MSTKRFVLVLCLWTFAAAKGWADGEFGSGAEDLEEGLSEEETVIEKNEAKSSGQRPYGPPPPFFELAVDALYFPYADLDGPDGELAEKTLSAELGWTRVVSYNHFTRLTTSYSRRDYDVRRAEPYSGSLTEVNAVRVGGTFERPFNETWSGFATFRISLQSARGTPLSDGWNLPFAIGIGYSFSPKLTVGVGVLGILEAQLGARVIPIASLRWMPNDRLSIMTLNGVRASYKLGERKQWEIVSSILYETFVFAVTDLEGFDEEQGIVSQEYWQAQLGLNRSFGRQFQVGIALESRFNRNFEYYKSDDKFDEFDIDPAMGLRVSGSYRF